MMLILLMCLSPVFITTATDNVCDSLFTECKSLMDNYEQQSLPTQCETLERGLACLDQINQSCSIDVIRKTMVVQQQVYGIFWKCEADLTKQAPKASPSDALATKPKSSKTSSTGIKPSSTGSKQSSTGLQPSSTGNKPSATGSKPTVQGGSADDGSSSPNNNPIPSWDDVDPRQSVPGKKTGSTGDDADPLGDAENAPGKKPTPGGDDSDYADTRQNTAGEKPIGSTFNRDGDEPGLAGSSNPGLTKRPNLTTRKPISTTGRPTSSTWGPVVGANQLSPVEAEGRSADGAPRNAELSQERQDDRPGPVRNGSTLPTVSLVITLAALGMIETTLWNRCQ